MASNLHDNPEVIKLLDLYAELDIEWFYCIKHAMDAFHAGDMHAFDMYMVGAKHASNNQEGCIDLYVDILLSSGQKEWYYA